MLELLYTMKVLREAHQNKLSIVRSGIQKSQSKVLDKLLKGQARAKASIPSKNT